jgi:hypothetical protein
MQTLMKDKRAHPSCIPITSITGTFCLHAVHGKTIESRSRKSLKDHQIGHPDKKAKLS